MATYVLLLNYTQKAIENMKQSPNRLTAAKESARKRGAEIKAFYLTLGQYDAVTIMEAPDDQTVAAWVLETAAAGYVRTQTLRAFDETEYKKITGSV